MKQRLPSCPEAVYRCTFNSLRQRHSAELVRRGHKTHSLSSRFADVLSLECGHQQVSRPVKVDRSLSCAAPSTVFTSSGQLPSVDNTPATSSCTGLALMQPVSAGSSLILTSPSLQQLSFAADESGLLVASGSQCNSSANIDMPLSAEHSGLMTLPGDCPSSLLLAPVPASGRQFQQHSTDPHRVSATITDDVRRHLLSLSQK